MSFAIGISYLIRYVCVCDIIHGCVWGKVGWLDIIPTWKTWQWKLDLAPAPAFFFFILLPYSQSRVVLKF